MRRHGGLALVGILLAGCDGAGRAVSPIRLEPFVTLGSTSGDGAIATLPVVSARHRGGFRIVVPAFSTIGTLPLVFDDLGRYVGSLAGDSTLTGSFGGPMFTRFGPGDSIWVFDNSGRVLIFDARRRYVRTATLASVPTDAIVLGDGRMLVYGDTTAVVELCDANGAPVRGIGPAGGVRGKGTRHMILPAADGTFWTIATDPRLRFDHWDTAGTHLGALDPRPAWLDGRGVASARRPPSLERPPEPALVDAWLDTFGRLWMLGAVADRNWRAGLGRDSSGKVDVTDKDTYEDTIIDIRDLATGKPIVTTRFDAAYQSVAEPGVLVRDRQTSAGWWRAELVRVVLDDRTSRP